MRPAEGEETPPLFVAPDTNFIIHGRRLEHLTPAVLGVEQKPIWLIAPLVIDEIDDKANHNSARMHGAARAMQKRIEAAYDGADPTMRILQRRSDLNWTDLDREVPDDRFLAEIRAFADDGNDVRILSFDRGLRIHARQLKLAIIQDTDGLRNDEEDPTQKRVRELENEIADIKNAASDLHLRLHEMEPTLTYAPVLTPEMLERVVEAESQPETRNAPDVTAFDVLSRAMREAANYPDLLNKYREKLRAYIPGAWRRLFFTHALRLRLANDGQAAGETILVDVDVPDVITLTDKLQKSCKDRKNPRASSRSGTNSSKLTAEPAHLSRGV